ncbi:MAG: hypothetical protein PVI07_09790 [Anaerolineae bacterium]|jgi:hypothetical protein
MIEDRSVAVQSPVLVELERLVGYSPLIGGHRLVSVADVRHRQDERMNARICRHALRLIPEERLMTVRGGDFFVGSVDFMVRQLPDGGRQYIVLETNGGSNRGYCSLSAHDLDLVCNGYLEMLRFVDSPSPLFVIGHPNTDALLIEKIYLAERLRKEMLARGLCETARIIRLRDFRGIVAKGEGLIILSDYESLLPALIGTGDRVILNGHPVSAIIGDGVARRHYQMSRGEQFDVVLANWGFAVTDDKYLTYRAVEKAAEILTPFDVSPLQFWRADTVDELVALCETEREDMDLIIKPFQGSGGAGVQPIDNRSHIPVVIQESMGEFREKFGAWRSPFPYTVCEKVEAHRAAWRQSERNFDFRVYVARDGDQLLPVGALFRLALEPFTGENRKRALVVNLSGYGGVDTERGLGVSAEALAVTRLEEKDLAKMYAASAVLLSYVAANHQAIQA